MGNKKDKRKKGLIIGAAAGVLLLVLGGILIWNMNQGPGEEYLAEHLPDELLQYSLDGQTYTSELVELKLCKQKTKLGKDRAYCKIKLHDDVMDRTIYVVLKSKYSGWNRWKVTEFSRYEEDELALTQDYIDTMLECYELSDLTDFEYVAEERGDGCLLTFSYAVDNRHPYVTLSGRICFVWHIENQSDAAFVYGIKKDVMEVDGTESWNIDGSYSLAADGTRETAKLYIDAGSDGAAEIYIETGWYGEVTGEYIEPEEMSLVDGNGRLVKAYQLEGYNGRDIITYEIRFYSEHVELILSDEENMRHVCLLEEGDWLPEVLAQSEAPSGDVSEGSQIPQVTDDVIYVYGYGNQLSANIELFLEQYPEYADLIVCREFNSYTEFMDSVDLAFTVDEEVPSIVLYEMDYLSELGDTERFCSMEELGLTDEMYENAYGYTKALLTFDNKLMGMAPNAGPGCFFYRADIAREVFGTDDPEIIGEKLKDWDSFYAASEELKQKGYYMLSSAESLPPVYPSVTYGYDTYNFDLQVYDVISQNGYARGTQMWDFEWSDDMTGNVFGYFGTTWFAYVLEASFLYYDDAEDSRAEWKVCEGPYAFAWGGNCMGVTNACPNKGLAARMLYSFCCDEEFMYNFYIETEYNYPNNTAVVARLIDEGAGVSQSPEGEDNDDIWGYGLLGGQDPLPIFDAVGQRIGE